MFECPAGGRAERQRLGHRQGVSSQVCRYAEDYRRPAKAKTMGLLHWAITCTASPELPWLDVDVAAAAAAAAAALRAAAISFVFWESFKLALAWTLRCSFLRSSEADVLRAKPAG